MGNEERIMIKKVKETPAEKGACGVRRRLVTGEECGRVAFSHLLISDAKKHYHKETTEFYYVLKGQGMLETDDGSIPLSEGTLVMIKPGVAHRAVPEGDLEVLIAMAPPLGEAGDYFPGGSA